MIRKLPVLAALAVAAAVSGFSLQSANAADPTYRAVPATPMTGSKDITVYETLWSCTPDGCTTRSAQGGTSRVCGQAAKKLGVLASFEVNAVAIEADKLVECNAKAAS